MITRVSCVKSAVEIFYLIISLIKNKIYFIHFGMNVKKIPKTKVHFYGYTLSWQQFLFSLFSWKYFQLKLSLVREWLTTRVMMKVMLLPISVMAVILINCCQHVEGFFPYFQPFPYIRRRPARPQNPIYVQADRISKVRKDKKKGHIHSFD